MAYVTDYTALLTGSYWNGIEVAGQPSIVTYSFDTTAPPSDQANLSASAYSTFTPLTASQQQEATQGLQDWGKNSGLIFYQVPSGQGDINFASYNFSTDPNYSNAGGVGFYPFGNWDYATYPYFATDNAGSGNVLFNTAFESGGLFDYATVLHEEGHALGLKHPDQTWTDYATNPATVHNVWDPNVALPSSVMNEGATTLTDLAPIDIQAIQAVYGTPSQQGTEDKSYAWNATTYTLTQHVANTATQEVRGISTNNTIFAGTGTDNIYAIGAGKNVVHDGAGTDTVAGGLGTTTVYAGTGADTFIGTFGKTTVDYTGASGAVGVDLLATYQDAGAAADDSFIDIHAVNGSAYADTLVADNSGDTLNGEGGNDVLFAGTGADHLTGGAGADSFVYEALADSTVAASGRDTITDFSDAQGDTINLAGLASSTGQALTFIGTAAFDHTAGEIRYAASGNNTLVSIDDNGKGKADFSILLTGTQTLTARDFVLTGSPPPQTVPHHLSGSGFAASLGETRHGEFGSHALFLPHVA